MHDKYIIMHNRASNFLCQAEKIFRIKRFSKISIERILSRKPGGRDRKEVCGMLHLPSVVRTSFVEVPILFSVLNFNYRDLSLFVLYTLNR